MNKKMRFAVFLIFIAALSLCALPADAATEHDAKEALDRAQNAISFMSALGFKTERSEDLLKDSKIFIDSQDYEKSIESSGKIILIKESAVNAAGKINITRTLLDSAQGLGVNLSDAREKLMISLADFEAENYENALLHADLIVSEIAPKMQQKANQLHESAQNLEASANALGLDASSIGGIFADLARAGSKNFDGLLLIAAKISAINKSLSGLLSSSSYLDEMTKSSFPSSKIEDLIKESRLMIELGNFERAENLAIEIQATRNSAFAAASAAKEAGEIIASIKNEGYNMEKAQALLLESSSSFGREDYEASLRLAGEAISNARISKESALLFGIINRERIAFNVAGFLKAHWILVSTAILLAAVVAYPASNYTSRHILQKKKKSLEKEDAVITSMIKRIQEDYYRTKNISKSAYDRIMDNHQERRLKIKESIPLIKMKISRNEENLSGYFRVFKYSRRNRKQESAKDENTIKKEVK